MFHRDKLSQVNCVYAKLYQILKVNDLFEFHVMSFVQNYVKSQLTPGF